MNSVIVTNMAKPKICGNCDLWNIDKEFCMLLHQNNSDKMTVRKDCTLKSIDALIEKLHIIAELYPISYNYMHIDINDATQRIIQDARDYGIRCGIEIAIKTIKDYCEEMEDF